MLGIFGGACGRRSVISTQQEALSTRKLKSDEKEGDDSAAAVETTYVRAEGIQHPPDLTDKEVALGLIGAPQQELVQAEDSECQSAEGGDR